MKKQIMFSLLIVAIAAGASAFTSAKRLNQYVYVLNEDQMTYNRVSASGQLPSEGACEEVQELTPCNISYTSDKGSSFQADNIPAGGLESSQHGYWAE